ncbi:MAG TPA: hypothetical protein VFK80_02705, partial [Limnochordia bacterium]|nr:hypothetical protein [Limnochordia bacterium]
SGTLSSAQTDVDPGQAVAFPAGSQWAVHVARDGNWVRVSGRLGDQERQLTLPACGPIDRLAGGVGIPVCGSAPAGGALVGVHGFVVVTQARLWAHFEVLAGNSRHSGDAVGETTRFAADPG